MIKINSFPKLLAAFIAFITLMLTCRFIYSGSMRYIFLLWNLFLAWVPFQLSMVLVKKQYTSRLSTIFLLGGWLLFFPNALYIITDLIHLKDFNEDAPIWFDAILLFTSSVAGLMMAFASLFKIENFLYSKIKNVLVDRLIIGCLFLGSFGVYLGRFLRWNSWDIFADPFKLLNEVIAPIVLPLQHYKTWGVTTLLTCLFSLLYYAIKKLPGLLNEPGNKFIV